MTATEADVLTAYLCRGQSHREIQREILHLEAPARGGGFKTMEILHKFGIRKEHKSILSRHTFDPQKFERAGDIKAYVALED